MATMLDVLRAIQHDQKARHTAAEKASSQFTYKSTTKSGVAPYSDTGGRGKKSAGILTAGAKTSRQESGHHSNNPLSILGNLAGDVKDAAIGIPGGIVQTIEHPIGTTEAIAKDYKRRYGPLFGYLNGGGDIHKFGQELADHPLAPLLDLASVATAGGGLAAKVGQSATVARAVEGAHAAEAAKGAAALAEKTAPLRKTVDRLQSKTQKMTVDKNMAEARVNDMKVTAKAKPKPRQVRNNDANTKLALRHMGSTHDPFEVQASSAKALTKHEAKLKAHHDMIDSLHKQINEHETAHSLASHQLKGGVRQLEKLKKATTPTTRKIGGKTFKEISVAQSGNPVKRLRQNLGIDLQQSRLLPDKTPLIGLQSRLKKAANLEHQHVMGTHRIAQRAATKAIQHMEKVAGTNPERHAAMAAAVQGLVDGVAPKDYARTVKDTRSSGESIQQSIRDGKTQAEHHALTAEIVKPHLSKQANEIYAAAKQHLQRESMESGKVIDGIHIQHGFKSKLIDSPEVKAVVAVQKAHEAAATSAMEHMVKAGQLTRDQASKQAVLHTTLSRAVQGKKALTVEETNAAFDKAGLPRPSYNPDTLTIGDAGKKENVLKESQGKLYTQGTRSMSPRNIIARHEVASKMSDAKHAHLMMLSVATKIKDGEKLPDDHVWVPDTLAKTLKEKKSAFEQQLKEGLPAAGDYYDMLSSEARPKSGLAISKSMRDDIVGGRKQMSAGRNEAVTKAMTIWKYATLATRPGFLTTNILSNTFMAALKSSWNFPAMLRTRAALRTGVFDEHHFSEGTTFGASEKISGGKNKLTRGISHAANAMYTATGWHEHQMRQYLMYDTARRLPAVKAEMRRLKGGKLDTSKETLFHQAYSAAVKKNPAIRGLVTRNMDDAMGNYRYYTAQEKMLKNISPFYSWERHSVRNMIRMFEDNPATMAILTQVGMQGDKRFKRDFGNNMPAFVHSYIEDKYIKTVAEHLGMGGAVNMYDFNSVNPYTTSVQVGELLGGGKSARDAAVGLSGPLFTAPLEEITGKSALTGAPAVKTHTNNPFTSMIERVAMQTPPYTVGQLLATDKGSKKKLLPEDKAQTIYRTMGLYFKNLDKQAASDMNTSANAPHDKYGHVIKKKKKVNSIPYPNAS